MAVRGNVPGDWNKPTCTGIPVEGASSSPSFSNTVFSLVWDVDVVVDCNTSCARRFWGDVASTNVENNGVFDRGSGDLFAEVPVVSSVEFEADGAAGAGFCIADCAGAWFETAGAAGAGFCTADCAGVGFCMADGAGAWFCTADGGGVGFCTADGGGAGFETAGAAGVGGLAGCEMGAGFWAVGNSSSLKSSNSSATTACCGDAGRNDIVSISSSAEGEDSLDKKASIDVFSSAVFQSWVGTWG